MSNTSSLTTSFLFLSLQFTSFESSLLFTPYELEIKSVQAHSRVNGPSRARLFRFQFVRFMLRVGGGFDLVPFRKNVVHSSSRPRCLGNLYSFKSFLYLDKNTIILLCMLNKFIVHVTIVHLNYYYKYKRASTFLVHSIPRQSLIKKG